MAYYSFTEAIERGEPIHLFNQGEMERDFTYIDDVVRGTIAAIDYDGAYELFNLGNHGTGAMSTVSASLASSQNCCLLNTPFTGCSLSGKRLVIAKIFILTSIFLINF